MEAFNNKSGITNTKKTSKATSLSSITKKGKSIKSSLLEKFNLLGKHRWVNLENMPKSKALVLTNLRKCTTKYGERIMVELGGELQLYLPERYNTFTDRQLVELGNGQYSLINHGMNGKIYRLEVLKTEDVSSTSSAAIDTVSQGPNSPDPRQDVDEEEDELPDALTPISSFYGYEESQRW